MGITGKLGVAAVLLSGIALTSPARAQFPDICGPGGCTIESGEFVDLDYTVRTDGRTYLWQVRFESDDPAASVSLDEPTQLGSFALVRLPGGDLDFVFDGFPEFTFAPQLSPGLLSIRTRGPRAFDNCDRPGPVGQVCGRFFEVFGNGTRLNAFGTAPVTVFLSESLVPEPASWALLIAGFGLTGAALRRSRAHARAG